MKRFTVSATGGTFDMLHKGHTALLAKSFELSETVIIGLCGDRMAAKKGKKPSNTYARRLDNLRKMIGENFPGAKYRISRLEDDFGPAVLHDKVDALIASEETCHKGEELNLQRGKNGLKSVEIIAVPMVPAYDGRPISSTRIRRGQVDADGHRA